MIAALPSAPRPIASTAILLLALFPAHASAQTGASLASAPDIHVDVNLVNILCTARNRRGAYAVDLTKSDFQVLEDGKPQEIRYFTRELDIPFTVALLFDVSGSVRRTLEDERLAALRFFYEVFRPGDKGLIESFSHAIVISQDLTSSGDQLRRAVMAIRPLDLTLSPEYDPHGGTLLYEAVQTVCDKRLAGLPGRKIIIIVSDGFDNGSRIDAEAAVKSSQLADAVTYAIHYSDASNSLEGERTLDHLSKPTGGREFSVGFGMPLRSVFGAISEEMRSQYAIGYISTNQSRDGAYRRLAVKTT